MRQIFSFLLLTILLAVQCSAQCPSNKRQLEITGSYSLVNTGQVIQDNSGGKAVTSAPGSPFVTIRYFVYNRLAIGITGGITTEEGHYSSRFDPAAVTSTYTRNVTTIAPELYYIYFFRKYIEVYTLLGIGPGFFETTTTTLPSLYSSAAPATTVEKHDALRMQYTPIGVRVGGRIGAFAELGVGYKGIFNAGVSFKLGPSCWWRG